MTHQTLHRKVHPSFNKTIRLGTRQKHLTFSPHILNLQPNINFVLEIQVDPSLGTTEAHQLSSN